jgi:hypothetical protein
MIRSRTASRIAFASLIVTMNGCLEIETTTTVKTDGTLQRQLQISGDSAEVSRGVPTFPTDSTWDVVRHHTKDTSWTSVSTKLFSDGAALEKALNREDGKSLSVRVESERHFRWFTTEFSYRETILCYNQFHAVPLSDYISRAELDRWIHHEIEKAPYPSPDDSVTIHKSAERAEEWDSRNKFEALFGIFTEGATRLNDPGLTIAQIASAKESLYAHCAKLINESRLDTLPLVFERTLKNPLASKVFAMQSDRIHEFADKVKFQLDMLGTPYKRAHVIMPGLITETNARSIEGNKLTWEEFIGACYVVDYTMWARSRVINWWAVVLTGGVVILLTGILVVGMVRRKRVPSIVPPVARLETPRCA